MRRFIPRLGVNPIIIKELRSRMRGPRAFITLTVILLLIGGLMYAMMQIILSTSRYTNILSPVVGQSLFAALAYLELFMICAITPAVTAGAISSEKEKQTYEMLMATPLSPTRILWGKLVSAMSFIFLLLFAAVPLASVVFIFGGVAPVDMIRTLLVLLVIAVTLGFLGLFMSSLFGRTGWATVASFITVIILTVGPIFIAVLVGVIQEHEPPRWLLAPSPVSALAAVLAPSLGQDLNGIFGLFSTLSGVWNSGINPVSQTQIPRPLYHYSLPFYVGLSLVLYLLFTRLVQPFRRFQLKAKEILVGAAILAAFCALVGLGFWATSGRYEQAVNSGPIAPTEAPAIAIPAGAMPQKDQRVVVVGPASLAPTATPEKVVEVDVAIDMKTQIEIYGAVARQLYTIDSTFGSDAPPNWPILYLAQNTDDSVGDPNQVVSKSVVIDEKIEENITSLLRSLPAEIRWTPLTSDTQNDPNNGLLISGDAALITFGNLHSMSDGTVQVSASLVFGPKGGTGKTYILSNNNGNWVITGTTGVGWIS